MHSKHNCLRGVWCGVCALTANISDLCDVHGIEEVKAETSGRIALQLNGCRVTVDLHTTAVVRRQEGTTAVVRRRETTL